jgi:glycerophosphoryl diester phosphodiesterase
MNALNVARAVALVCLALLPPFAHAAAPPIVIAHRGASGERPEHTLMAYELAIEQGADFIEPDLVMSKDGVLIARHENEISETTDVAARPEFADRKRTKSIDGREVTGWFSEDFTLAELKSLRARERLPALRPQNTAYDGQEPIPTLDEVIALVQRKSREKGRTIGLYPETKHPSYFQAIGLAMEAPLVKTLHEAGYRGREAPVFIQSFETANLRALATMTDLPLVQLIAPSGAPWDLASNGDPRTYADLISDRGLSDIETYAVGIGVEKTLLIPRDAQGRSQTPTDLVQRAKAAGLKVHVWTFRNENVFLPAELRRGEASDPRFRAMVGDAAAEYKAFYALEIDGLFSDFPAAALAVRR